MPLKCFKYSLGPSENEKCTFCYIYVIFSRTYYIKDGVLQLQLREAVFVNFQASWSIFMGFGKALTMVLDQGQELEELTLEEVEELAWQPWEEEMVVSLPFFPQSGPLDDRAKVIKSSIILNITI